MAHPRFIVDTPFLLAVFGALPLWVLFYYFDLAQVWGLAPPPAELVFWVLALLVYPIVEELSFRGWLQGRLLNYSSLAKERLGLTPANLLTSALFAALHVVLQGTVVVFWVLLPSLLFGFFRERFQGVVPSIVLHVYYNAGWFIMLSL